MLKVFIGEGEEALKMFMAAREKVSDAHEEVRISSENWNEAILAYLLEGEDLFGEKKIIFLEGILEDENLKDFFFSRLRLASESENYFFLREKKVLADDKRKLSSFGEIFSSGERAVKTEAFNVFTLGDLLLSKKKKEMWIAYREALEAGVTPEGICGALFWQMKTLLVASRGGGNDLAPYALMKAKKALQTFPPEEAEEKLRNLLFLYHEARTGKFPLETALERFILSL